MATKSLQGKWASPFTAVLMPAHWRANTDPEEDAEAQLDDEGPAQICPHCGKRYGYGVRVCARDDNELSALN